MQVAVIGLGKFGVSLAERLHELGHRIIALDLDPKAVAHIQSVAEVAATADARDRSALEELGVHLSDAAVVSLGSDMAVSILVTLHLKELRLKRIISKAVSPEHEKILHQVGASDVVFPERDAARRLAATITHPNMLDYLPLSEEFSVAELAPPKDFAGKTLAQLDLRRRYGVNVIGIKQVVPERFMGMVEPTYVIKDSDLLLIMGRTKDIDALDQIQ